MESIREQTGKPRTAWILALSAVLALLCTLISYPGIWYSDSYVRVATGRAVLNAAVKTLTGHRMPLETGNAFTVIPSFFIAFSQGLTGHEGLYTFCQAFAFFSAVFLLIRELSGGYRKTLCVLFGLCPVIYGMSVYLEAGIGCLTGMIWLFLLLRRAEKTGNAWERTACFLLTAFASFVTFGYRTNALTILPVLAFMLIRRKDEKTGRRLAALAVIAGMLLTRALPWIIDVRSQTTATAGIVWEMLTAIQRMEPEEQEEYLGYLDEIGGEGSTRAALQISSEETAGSFMWGDALGIGKMSAPGATVTALRKYVRLLIEKPGVWLRTKWDVIRRSMGIGHSLDASEYNYNRWDQMADYGFNDSRQRHAFYDSCVGAIALFGFFTLHPWVPFALSLGMLAVRTLRKGRNREAYLSVFLLAAFYYLAYLLDTPAYDYRYFYPSLVLLTVMDAAMAADFISGLRPEETGSGELGIRGYRSGART